MDINFIPENVFINYLKRWTALNVKILAVENSILNTTNENTASYLRDYKNELQNIKQEEKELIKNSFINTLL